MGEEIYRDPGLRLGFIIGLLAWIASFWWGVHLGCNAYLATPNIEPYEVLVDAKVTWQDSGAAKFSYLFGPMLLGVFATGALLAFPTQWLDDRFGPRGVHDRMARLYLAVVSVWMMILIVSVHSSHALSAFQDPDLINLAISKKAPQPSITDPVVRICKITN